MTKSWPEELALHMYSGCLVSPMNRSIDSSVQWTTWPTLIYVGVFCPLGGTVSVCVAKTYSKSNPGAFIGQLSGNNGQLSISQLYWECISIAPDKTKSIETHKWRWHEDSCWQSKIRRNSGFPMLSRMNILLMVKLICPLTLEPLKFGNFYTNGYTSQCFIGYFCSTSFMKPTLFISSSIFFNHFGVMWSPNHEDFFIDQTFLGPLVNITGKKVKEHMIQNNARF